MPKEESFQILYEVKAKCSEINNKVDSILRLLEILETYMTYSNLMQEMGPPGGDSRIPPPSFSSKGNDAMNPQELQKILSSVKNNDKPMSEDEFNTIFETMKQGKSQEEIARMEQMVQMAKNFMK